MKISEVRISLCDAMNPSAGYQIRVLGVRGETVLLASRDPADGSDLATYGDAVRVAGYYR